MYDFVNFGGCAAILNTVFTRLNAAEFINTLVPKINVMTIQIAHYSLLTNNVYALNFTIDCWLTHMWPTIQGVAFNQVNMVFLFKIK